jgi:Holliday junction DNA helicase RuvA
MIASVTGELRRVGEQNAHLQIGPILCELLVPASDIGELEQSIGQEITFHTVFYIQGDASGGSLEPRLIGFLRPEDKRFFEKFITVKGIGPKTALRALTVPVGEIAQAIEQKDTRALSNLKGIGKRTAELMIAELSGKVSAFMGIAPARTSLPQRTDEDETAIAFLTSPQMGLRRAEAEMLLSRAKQANPDATTADDLVPEMLKLHAQRV